MNKTLPFIASLVLLFACSKHNSVTPPGGTSDTSALSGLAISSFSPLSAPADSIVTITGANFSPNIANDVVKFNDTLATVKSATASELTVVVPLGASTGKITMTVGNKTATSANNFTVEDQWTLMKAYPGTIMGSTVSFTIGTKLYIGLGQSAFGSNFNSWLGEFWQYDAVANVWTRKADYPGTPTGYGAGFAVAGFGYAVNNPDGFGNATLWQYDTGANKWTRKANFPGGQLGIVAFGMNNYGYAGLGTLSGYNNNTFWQYDPGADAWTQKSNFPGRATVAPASFVIGNSAYVGTGMIGENSDSVSAEFYQYNIAADTWTKLHNFPGMPRFSAAGFSIGNFGYLGAGQNFTTLGDFWQYNPSGDVWVQKRNFAGGVRAPAAGFSGSSQGYLGFGNGALYQIQPGYEIVTYADLWQYQP